MAGVQLGRELCVIGLEQAADAGARGEDGRRVGGVGVWRRGGQAGLLTEPAAGPTEPRHGSPGEPSLGRARPRHASVWGTRPVAISTRRTSNGNRCRGRGRGPRGEAGDAHEQRTGGGSSCRAIDDTMWRRCEERWLREASRGPSRAERAFNAGFECHARGRFRIQCQQWR